MTRKYAISEIYLYRISENLIIMSLFVKYKTPMAVQLKLPLFDFEDVQRQKMCQKSLHANFDRYNPTILRYIRKCFQY